MSQTHQRLARLLGLVPYLTRRPGERLEDTAKVFGVSEQQLIDDLMLLFVTGRPGGMPDDLIDARWEDGQIFLDNADEVSIPVRLSLDESISLVLALEHLKEMGLHSEKVIDQVVDKLQRTTGLAPRTPLIDPQTPTIPEGFAEIFRDAITQQIPLSYDYYVRSRDEITHRIVMPDKLRLHGQWYLDAYCYTAQAWRTFAVNNIENPRPVDTPEEYPLPGVDKRGENTEGSAPAEKPVISTADITFSAQGAWLADTLDTLHSSYDTHGTGTVSVRIHVYSQDWLIRFLMSYGRFIICLSPKNIAIKALAKLTAQE